MSLNSSGWNVTVLVGGAVARLSELASNESFTELADAWLSAAETDHSMLAVAA